MSEGDKARELYFAMKDGLREQITSARRRLGELWLTADDEGRQSIEHFMGCCDSLVCGLSKVT